MRRKFLTLNLIAAVAVTAGLLGTSSLRADEPAVLEHATDGEVTVNGSVGHLHDGACVNCFPRPAHNPDLFYNYYQPVGCGTIGSSLYMSPGPVPQHVGHTYITYQPFMPHEFMYAHGRTYYKYYDGGRGLNRTHIKYYSAPFTHVGRTLSHFKIAR